MTKVRQFNGYNANIMRLKNYINLNYQGDKILLIMFNSVMNTFPSNKWYALEDNFFLKLPSDMEKMVIYTILAYKIGNSFLSLEDIIINDIIETLIRNDISPYKIDKYTKVFMNQELNDKVLYGYYHHLIKPRHIYKIVMDSYKLDDEVLEKIDKFIKEHEIKIFKGNYNFFNVYQSLMKLTTLEFFEENISVLELIPLFNTIESDEIKMQIQKDFARVEENNKPLIEKIEDCLVIAHHYAYDLPLAQKKRDRSL